MTSNDDQRCKGQRPAWDRAVFMIEGKPYIGRRWPPAGYVSPRERRAVDVPCSIDVIRKDGTIATLHLPQHLASVTSAIPADSTHNHTRSTT